ncbi:hypothetical protein AB205_0125140, partial [Aquarana catesbeiana]
LQYVISHTQLETRTLQLSVWHNDRFGRNSFLGEVNIPLDAYNFENQEDEIFTLQAKMDLNSDVILQYKGEITVGLHYIPPEKNLTLPLEPVTVAKKSFRRSKKIPMPTGGILEGPAILLPGNLRTFMAFIKLPSTSKTVLDQLENSDHDLESLAELSNSISYGNEVNWMDSQGEEQYLWQKMMDSPGTSVEGTLMLRSTKARYKKATQKS